MRKIIEEEGVINIQNFRERHTLSRKYLVAYLEYLDHFSEIGKEGNNRKYV
jgi:selenocysteine-specific elongation factor